MMKETILKLMQALAVTVLLVVATMVKAEVYKCTGADGKAAFSDQPCAAGQKAAVIKPQVSSAPAVLTDEQKTKAYDKIVGLTAKKLDDPKFKEQCRVARQRMTGIGKDKTGQTRPEELAVVKTQVQECDARLGEYIGSELARAEHENKLVAAEAAKANIGDCKQLQLDYANGLALASEFRSKQKSGDKSGADARRYQEAGFEEGAKILRNELSKRRCTIP
jgi:Domain of unknown function (DUF4124)